MIKKLSFLLFLLFISCNRLTPLSKYSIDEIKNISKNFVFKEFKENIPNTRMRIHKKGYGKWYILLYGNFYNYYIEIDEMGNIINYEKINHM